MAILWSDYTLEHEAKYRHDRASSIARTANRTMATDPSPPESLQNAQEAYGEQEAAPSPFRSPQLLGALACIGLGLNIAVAVTALCFELGFNDQVSAAVGVDFEMPNDSGDQPVWMTAADLALNLLRFATGVFFLAWMYRVHGNLLALGHRALDWKPIAGLIVWFIPLVGLVLPCLVMREITWRSDPRAESLGRDNQSLIMVNWWWGTFLVAPIAFCLDLLIPDTLDSMPEAVAFRWNVTLYGSVIVSGILASWLILRINSLQAERFRLVEDHANPLRSGGSESK